MKWHWDGYRSFSPVLVIGNGRVLLPVARSQSVSSLQTSGPTGEKVFLRQDHLLTRFGMTIAVGVSYKVLEHTLVVKVPKFNK